MSKRRRRRPPRNIWGAPPEPSRPFDFEDPGEPEVVEPEAALEEPTEAALEEPTEAEAVVLDEFEDSLAEEVPLPEPPRGPKHLQKRAVVLPRFGKRGKHLARADAASSERVEERQEPVEVEPAAAEPEPVFEEEPVEFDEELLPEGEIFPTRARRRSKHRKRTIVPRKSPQGKHSLGASPPRAPAQPDLPELEMEGLEEVEPPDQPEFLEDIEPYEPRTKKRRRRRGRHRDAESGLLPKQKGRRGRHSISDPRDAEPDAPEEEPEVIDAFEDFVEEGGADVIVEEGIPEATFDDAIVEELVDEVAADPTFDVADEEVIVLEDEVDDAELLQEPELDEVDAFFEEEIEEEEVPELLPPRRKRRKRSRLFRNVVGLLTAIATAAATVAIAAAIDTGRPESDDGGPRSDVAAAPEELATTTLVYGVREAHEEEGPVWLTLLAYDPSTQKASAIYIPAHLASEIPGRGLMSLSEGWVSGGPSLLLASAENLLGMKIDRYVEFSDNDAEILFDATGPITVDVPSEVSVAQGSSQSRLIFDEGPQELAAEFLVRLLYTRGLDVDDAELGSRILAFWDALLEHHAGDRTALGSAIRGTGPALESDAATNEIVTFFESLASVPEEQLVLVSLPVRPIAAGDSELYSADLDAVQDLLQDTVGEVAATGEDVRVQILNGNGVPGIGAEVADRLIGEGFRVILSGNARSFDYDTTLIVTYDDSPEGEALAEKARELLGVGEVQISAQQQGSVDLTIVVGKDFLGAR